MEESVVKLFVLFAVICAATACPAKCRTGYRNGHTVKECSCAEHPGKIYVDLNSVGRGDVCLDQCGHCPNGFCHENKCYCFDNKPSDGRSCPKYCQDCQGGYCTGWSGCPRAVLPPPAPLPPPAQLPPLTPLPAVCPGGCRNGLCLHPGICHCDKGYYHMPQMGGCEPLCFLPCTNGYCSAPGTCACNPGYKLTPIGSCAPIIAVGVRQSNSP